MSKKKTTIECTPRQIIDDRLLAALDGEGKAAILCSRDELEMLIEALAAYPSPGRDAQSLLAGMKDLKKAAFGE